MAIFVDLTVKSAVCRQQVSWLYQLIAFFEYYAVYVYLYRLFRPSAKRVVKVSGYLICI